MNTTLESRVSWPYSYNYYYYYYYCSSTLPSGVYPDKFAQSRNEHRLFAVWGFVPLASHSNHSGTIAMAASQPPKGLPGFLRRSLRNPYDDPDGSDEVGGGPLSSRPRLPLQKEQQSHLGGGPEAVSGPSVREAEIDESVSSAERDGLEEEEEDLKREEEAVEAATSRVNRKFRFGLSLGGGGVGETASGGTAVVSATNRPTGLSGRSSSAPSSAASMASDFDQHLHQQVLGSGSDHGPASAASGSSGDSGPPQQPQRSYKDATFERTMRSPVVNVAELRKLSWNGIPPVHRATAWKILLGYLPANASRRNQSLERKRAEYRDAIAQHYDIDDNTRTAQEQETLRQVLVDVPRTAPDLGLFRDVRIKLALGRLLYIWACRHPASSYVQGINDLATPLIVVFLSGHYGGTVGDVLSGKVMDDGDVSDDTLFEVETDTYWCLTNLLAGIQDHYTADQPGVQRMVMRLEELVARIDADLTAHLRETGIEFFQFAFKWMNCLLLREFNLPCVLRLWDTYLSEGDGGFERFHVYVCAAFLCQFSAEVRSMKFDELFGFMQNMPTGSWGDGEVEIVLSQAFVLSTLFGGSDAHLIPQR